MEPESQNLNMNSPEGIIPNTGHGLDYGLFVCLFSHHFSFVQKFIFRDYIFWNVLSLFNVNFFSSASAPYSCIQQQTIYNMHPELFFLLLTVILGQSKKGLSTYPIGLYNFLRIEKYANVGCDNYLKCRYKFFTKNKNQKTSYSNLTTPWMPVSRKKCTDHNSRNGLFSCWIFTILQFSSYFVFLQHSHTMHLYSYVLHPGLEVIFIKKQFGNTSHYLF